MAIALNRSRQVPADETPAFGGIAERFRRAGDLERAVALCRDGLKKFPDHLSARVTLGWSLLDLGRYDEAQVELEQVLKRAPDNLAAIRGLAELHERAENAVVVPIEDHEAAEVAAALEAARILEAEKPPPAPAEPAKRAKAQLDPPPAKAKAEPHVEPDPPHAAPASKHQPTGKSLFAESMRTHDAPKTETRTEKIETKAAAVETTPATVEPTSKIETSPAPPALELLAAEFEAAPEPFVAEPPKPEPSAVIEPVRVLDSRGEEVPDLTRAAAIAETSVEAAAASVDIPNLLDELVSPAAAAMSQPADLIDEFVPPPTSELTASETVVDDASLAELPIMDFSADADALLSSNALLSATEPEPAANAPLHSPEIDQSHASLLGAEALAEAVDAHPQPELTESYAPAAQPEPDVNELLAQLAQDQDTAQSASMFAAEPVVPVDAHPQPDVADFAAQLEHDQRHDQPIDAPQSAIFAADAFAAAPELHPEPELHAGPAGHPVPELQAEPDLADAMTAVAGAAAFDAEPAWASTTPDFVAALEATHIEPVVVPEPEPAGPAFELSAELPAAATADDFVLASEPVAALEAAADQLSMLEQAMLEPVEPPAKLGTAQVLNFEVPTAPPDPAPKPVAAEPVAPPAIASVFETVVAPVPPPAPEIVAPPASPKIVTQTIIEPNVFGRIAAEPVAAPAPVTPAPKTASLLKKKNRNVAALEKMLRRIAARRLEVASEYQPS